MTDQKIDINVFAEGKYNDDIVQAFHNLYIACRTLEKYERVDDWFNTHIKDGDDEVMKHLYTNVKMFPEWPSIVRMVAITMNRLGFIPNGAPTTYDSQTDPQADTITE